MAGIITVPVTFYVQSAGGVGGHPASGKSISGQITRDKVRVLNPDSALVDGPPPGPEEIYQSTIVVLASNNNGYFDYLTQAQLDQIVVDPPDIDIQYPEPGQTIEGTISYPDTEDWFGLQEISVLFDTGVALWRGRVIGVYGALTINRIGRTYNFKTFPNSTGGTTGDVYATQYPITQVEIEMNGELIGSGVNQSYNFVGFEASGPVRIRMVDALGASTKWRTVYMPPVAEFSLIDTANPVFKVNGLQSFSPTSRITEYRWGGELREGVFNAGNVPPSGIKNDGLPVAEIDFSAIPAEAVDEMSGQIRLVVFDTTGLTELDGHPISYPPTGRVSPTGLFGVGYKSVSVKPDSELTAIHSPHGELFMAKYEKQGTTPGVVVERSVTTVGNKAVLSRIAAIGRGRLFQNSDGRPYMAGVQLLPGTNIPMSWDIWQTLDCGETFVPMMLSSPFSFTLYPNVVPCQGVADGLFALAARKEFTQEVHVSVYNGSAWSELVLAVTLPEDTIQNFAFFQESVSGSSRFRICTATLDYCSDDTCETWEPTP